MLAMHVAHTNPAKHSRGVCRSRCARPCRRRRELVIADVLVAELRSARGATASVRRKMGARALLMVPASGCRK